YYRIDQIRRLSFFFQAEDGIRDPLVTGVQTCALPISLHILRLAVGQAACSYQAALTRLQRVAVCAKCDRDDGGRRGLSGRYRAAAVGCRVKAVAGRDAVGRGGAIFSLRLSR